MNIAILENEKVLAQACLDRLKQALGPGIPARLGQPQERQHDFALHIGTKPALDLVVEAKTRIATRNQALHIILQLQDMAGKAMVFADWIPEPIGDEFRKAGVFFADAQGNIFLRRPPR